MLRILFVYYIVRLFSLLCASLAVNGQLATSTDSMDKTNADNLLYGLSHNKRLCFTCGAVGLCSDAYTTLFRSCVVLVTLTFHTRTFNPTESSSMNRINRKSNSQTNAMAIYTTHTAEHTAHTLNPWHGIETIR